MNKPWGWHLCCDHYYDWYKFQCCVCHRVRDMTQSERLDEVIDALEDLYFGYAGEHTFNLFENYPSQN